MTRSICFLPPLPGAGGPGWRGCIVRPLVTRCALRDSPGPHDLRHKCSFKSDSSDGKTCPAEIHSAVTRLALGGVRRADVFGRDGAAHRRHGRRSSPVGGRRRRRRRDRRRSRSERHRARNRRALRGRRLHGRSRQWRWRAAGKEAAAGRLRRCASWRRSAGCKAVEASFAPCFWN